MARLSDVLQEAWDAEQVRLRTLPWKKPERNDDWYYLDANGKLTLTECNYTGREGEPVKDHEAYRAKREFPDEKTFVRCSLCYIQFPASQLFGGMLPEHARALNRRDHARELYEVFCQLVGVDGWSGDALYGFGAAETSRAATLGGALAAGLPHLVSHLVRADATAGAAKELRELLELRIDGAEHPFFTEATLYELLGKSDARTVLAHTRSLANVSGFKDRTG